MPLELPIRPRVRLPDSLPDLEVPSAPHRGRGGIIGLAFAAYAAVVALCVGLSSGALSWWKADGADPGAPSVEAAAAPIAASSPASGTNRIETAPAIVERAAPAQAPVPPSPPAPDGANPPGAPPPTGLPSCEEAARMYKDDLSEGSAALPRDMTESAYGALLDGPATQRLLSNCAAHGWRHAEVCVAVRGFRAVGVSVETDPQDGSVERCITRTLAGLSFSHQPVLKIIRSEIGLMPES